MITVRFTPDPKYEIYDNAKFIFKPQDNKQFEPEIIQPSVELFLQPGLIKAQSEELYKLDSELTDAMKKIVTEYTMLNLSQSEIKQNLAALLTHIQGIQKIIQGNKKFNYFLYNHAPETLLEMQNAGENIMPFDVLLFDTPEIQRNLISRLLTSTGKLPAHRPNDLETHKNKINKSFIIELMRIFQCATGKKATPSSVSTRNKLDLPILEKLNKTDKYDLRSKTPFEVFAYLVIKVINDSYPRLDNGYSITMNVNNIVKIINKKTVFSNK